LANGVWPSIVGDRPPHLLFPPVASQAAGTTAPDAKKYPHFSRYYHHVASFSAEERSAAPAIAGLSVHIGAAPAAAAAAKPAAAAAKGGGKKAAEEEEAEEDDDADSGLGDLFGDDDDDDDMTDLAAQAQAKSEAAKKKALEAKRAAARADPKRPVIAKSRIVFEVKPYDAETDLEALAAKIKAVRLEGEFWDEKLQNCEDERCTLLEGCQWGEGHHLQPVAFGIFKLIIQVIVHDDLVGSDDLQELLTEKFEDEIQSIDVAAFDKAS
jgi:elongation factor 1-beta